MKLHPIGARVIAILILFGASLLHSQTQGELDKQACGQFHKADEAMNETYSHILKEYAKDEQFIAKLKAAQRAWLVFRDADLEALFPKAGKQAEYGTVYPMCRCMQLQSLTEGRTKQLKLWLDGTREGDVCAGSIKVVNSAQALANPKKYNPQEVCSHSSRTAYP